MLESDTHEPLDRDQSCRLAAALESGPETTMDIHCLSRGLARAYVLGEPSAFDARRSGRQGQTIGHHCTLLKYSALRNTADLSMLYGKNPSPPK